jgi:hypothetical protein
LSRGILVISSLLSFLGATPTVLLPGLTTGSWQGPLTLLDHIGFGQGHFPCPISPFNIQSDLSHPCVLWVYTPRGPCTNIWVSFTSMRKRYFSLSFFNPSDFHLGSLHPFS